MAFYSPVTLLVLLPTWLILVWIGYAAMFWGSAGPRGTRRFATAALRCSRWASPRRRGRQTLLVFSEATVGLILVALLIAYLPTMYALSPSGGGG